MKSLEQIKSELDTTFETTSWYYLQNSILPITQETREFKLNELSTIIFNKFNGDDNDN
jgi:hypothetical protein